MRVTTERWAIDLGRAEAIVEEISQTIEYTKRKCELNGKDEDYFYLLFENELEDLIQRYYISIAKMNRRRWWSARTPTSAGLSTIPTTSSKTMALPFRGLTLSCKKKGAVSIRAKLLSAGGAG